MAEAAAEGGSAATKAASAARVTPQPTPGALWAWASCAANAPNRGLGRPAPLCYAAARAEWQCRVRPGAARMAADGDGDAGLRAVVDDLAAVAALRVTLAGLDPTAPPRAVIAHGAALPMPAARPAVGVLAGSFDPLTTAHAALARAALDAGGLDTLYLALSRRTVDKERVTRPTQADRALVLRLYARRHPRHGVLLFNRGLYAEQAVAARAAFPAAREVAFVVGFDKAVQIFDPRYYGDRDAALRDLFARVTLLVAPRGGQGAADLAALLARPENRPYRDAVRALPFDPAYAADSATAVRDLARAGRDVTALVPPETAAFLAAARPYAPPRRLPDGRMDDRYGERVTQVEAIDDRR